MHNRLKALSAVLQRARRWHRERRTIVALEALSARELEDLGLHRCAIPGIARTARAELAGG